MEVRQEGHAERCKPTSPNLLPDSGLHGVSFKLCPGYNLAGRWHARWESVKSLTKGFGSVKCQGSFEHGTNTTYLQWSVETVEMECFVVSIM